MPASIPNTTATVGYVEFGGGRRYAAGFIFVANGLVDVLLHHGEHASLVETSGPFTLPPGVSSLIGVGHDAIIGFALRASGGVLSTPLAQQFFASLWEPGLASMSAFKVQPG